MQDLNGLLQDLQNLQEIQRLLDEAYEHYFEHSDGYCKSSEGWVSVDFGNYWYREGNRNQLKIAEVKVYSYVFGPSRIHDFGSTGQALAAVKNWHQRAMNHEYCEDPDEPFFTDTEQEDEGQ